MIACRAITFPLPRAIFSIIAQTPSGDRERESRLFCAVIAAAATPACSSINAKWKRPATRRLSSQIEHEKQSTWAPQERRRSSRERLERVHETRYWHSYESIRKLRLRIWRGRARASPCRVFPSTTKTRSALSVCLSWRSASPSGAIASTNTINEFGRVQDRTRKYLYRRFCRNWSSRGRVIYMIPRLIYSANASLFLSSIRPREERPSVAFSPRRAIPREMCLSFTTSSPLSL